MSTIDAKHNAVSKEFKALSPVQAPGRPCSFKGIVIVLAIISFADLDFLTVLGLNSIFSALQLASAVLLVTCAVCGNVKIDAFCGLWFAFGFWIVFVTIVLNADMVGAIRFATKIVFPAVLFAYSRTDLELAIRCIYGVLSVLLVANFISLLLFPGGIYETGTTNFASENWLLGFKNKHLVYFLPLILATSYLCKIDGVTRDKVVVLVMVAVSTLIAGSGTAIVCIAVVGVFGLASSLGSNYKFLNARLYFVVGLILFYCIVILRLQDYLAFIIVDVLGKDLSFTNRTVLWDLALSQISEQPIIGGGYWSAEQKHALFNSQSIISAHNLFLEILFNGGIVALALFVAINILLVSRLRKCENRRVVQIAAAVYLGLTAAILVEVFEDFFFFFTYFMIWAAPEIDEIAQLRQARRAGKG